MVKIIGQIFEEEDYDVFKRLPDNRDVLSGRLNKLVASISQKYILNPIIVNEKMEIIDGQGRYEALKYLGLPIHYLISPGTTSEDCKTMNIYNSKWSALDFATSYAKAGKKAYDILLKTCKKTGLSIRAVLRLANRSSTKSRATATSGFEYGDLCFTEADCLMVQRIKEATLEIVEKLQLDGKPNDAFYTSVKIVRDTPGYNHKRMLKNCEMNRSSFVKMANLYDQLVEFERVYNYRARGANKLYFSDYLRGKGSAVRNYENKYSPYYDKDVSTLVELEPKKKEYRSRQPVEFTVKAIGR